MSLIEMTVQNQVVPIHAVWAHIQEPRGPDVFDYALRVSADLVPQVFAKRSAGLSWSASIAEDIRDAGTFVLDGLLDKLVKLSGGAPRVFEWVIISVDEVSGDTDGIRLRGRAVPFAPDRY